MTAIRQLAEMRAVCRSLGAEISSRAERRYFTAILWEDCGVAERDALSVQKMIQKQSAKYPRLVMLLFRPVQYADLCGLNGM